MRGQEEGEVSTVAVTLSPEARRVSRSDLLVVPCAAGCGTEIAVSGSSVRRDVERFCRACTYRRSHTILCQGCLVAAVVKNPNKARFCTPCANERRGGTGVRKSSRK
jgi:hypothetical protein